ncbi:hypothetical protein [Bradyrhizobium pachyrhizi]|uniref:hypothetical protein n=1 Tax=Bradyrhizobium pachyrhizi TaxID=280333 RepID=UPI003D36792A
MNSSSEHLGAVGPDFDAGIFKHPGRLEAEHSEAARPTASVATSAEVASAIRAISIVVVHEGEPTSPRCKQNSLEAIKTGCCATPSISWLDGKALRKVRQIERKAMLHGRFDKYHLECSPRPLL